MFLLPNLNNIEVMTALTSHRAIVIGYNTLVTVTMHEAKIFLFVLARNACSLLSITNVVHDSIIRLQIETLMLNKIILVFCL